MPTRICNGLLLMGDMTVEAASIMSTAKAARQSQHKVEFSVPCRWSSLPLPPFRNLTCNAVGMLGIGLWHATDDHVGVTDSFDFVHLVHVAQSIKLQNKNCADQLDDKTICSGLTCFKESSDLGKELVQHGHDKLRVH